MLQFPAFAYLMVYYGDVALGDTGFEGCVRLAQSYRSLPRPSSLLMSQAIHLEVFRQFHFNLCGLWSVYARLHECDGIRERSCTSRSSTGSVQVTDGGLTFRVSEYHVLTASL